jgi:hypothetical protein
MDHFVVRIWVPAAATTEAPDRDPGLHGVVSHVSSGRSETFRDGCELLRRPVDLCAPIITEPPAEPAAG